MWRDRVDGARRSVRTSNDAAGTLATEAFEPESLAERGYCNERLDQLVTDLILGLR